MGDKNPSVTDQVAKVREQLIKAAHEGYEPDPLLLQAARLIATLAAEVEDARRFTDHNAVSENTISYEVSMYRVTRAATDALLAEVKR